MTHAAAIRPGAAALLALLCLPLAARAEAPPLLVPTRDVDVVYRMPPPPGAATPAATTPAPTQRLRWNVADRRLRVDPPGEGVFCAACGRNLASVDRLPTRAEWQIAGAQDDRPLAERCEEALRGLGDHRGVEEAAPRAADPLQRRVELALAIEVP